MKRDLNAIKLDTLGGWYESFSSNTEVASWKIAYLWDEGWGEPIFMGAQFLSPCQGMIGCTGHRREVSQVAIMHNATMVPGFHFGVETRVGIDQWRNSTVYITYNIYIYIHVTYLIISICIYYGLYVFIMFYIYLDDW